jgi:hypothetical protein
MAIVAAARRMGWCWRGWTQSADEIVYLEHPDWFAVDAEGRPTAPVSCTLPASTALCRASDRHSARNHRAEPADGLTDNSWSGLDRDHLCLRLLRPQVPGRHRTLPRAANWDDPTYRRWIAWSYTCRIDVWELNNRVTREAGGPDCLWVGMNSGDLVAQSQRLRDYRAICARTEIIMLDSQARTSARGFQSNSEMGKLIHGLLGWEKLIPESTAMYGAGQPAFRVASKPPAEARMWAVAGFAGGIQPGGTISAPTTDRASTAPPSALPLARGQRAISGRAAAGGDGRHRLVAGEC